MTDCEYFAAGILCANRNSPYCGKNCPVSEHQEVCLYSTHNKPIRDICTKFMQRSLEKISNELINGSGGAAHGMPR